MKNLVINLIVFYQIFLSFDRGILRLITPGGVCKYPISCSEYTKQSIINNGILKGFWFGAKRILSCW